MYTCDVLQQKYATLVDISNTLIDISNTLIDISKTLIDISNTLVDISNTYRCKYTEVIWQSTKIF